MILLFLCPKYNMDKLFINMDKIFIIKGDQ